MQGTTTSGDCGRSGDPTICGWWLVLCEKNCALDVCWEGKKFREICSHLNPSSVMHLYAKNLDDLRSLVSARGSDMHVHIRVDAQTGLGTFPPRPRSENIGTATAVSHRVEKQRMLEGLIMENLVTATNTFLCEDDGATNIHTCNNHEPQQIDHILSSDSRLRSRTFDSSATNSDHWGLNTAEKDCQETNWMGMPGSHRFQ